MFDLSLNLERIIFHVHKNIFIEKYLVKYKKNLLKNHCLLENHQLSCKDIVMKKIFYHFTLISSAVNENYFSMSIIITIGNFYFRHVLFSRPSQSTPTICCTNTDASLLKVWWKLKQKWGGVTWTFFHLKTSSKFFIKFFYEQKFSSHSF